MAYRLQRPSAQASLHRPRKPRKMGSFGPGRVGPGARVGPPKGRPPVGPPKGRPPGPGSVVSNTNSVPPPTPPTPPNAPPPETTAGAAARNTARTTYSTAVSGYKNQLVQAALRLGSPEIIQALMRNPDYAEYVGALQQGMNDPNSTLALLNKGEKEGLTNVDNTANEGNTYFSGLRLRDRGKLTDDFNAQRSSAINDYRLGPEAEAAAGLGGALSDYNTAMNEALGLDIDSQLQKEPEPRAKTGPKKPKKPKKPRLKKKGKR